MEYNILRTAPTYGKRESKIVGHAYSLGEAEMLKQKMEKKDNTWATYELRMCTE